MLVMFSSNRIAILRRPDGLHMRPAARLSRIATSFVSTVSVRTSDADPWIDAKSLVSVLSLKARHAAVLQLRAEGSDAREAIEAMVGFIERTCDDY